MKYVYTYVQVFLGWPPMMWGHQGLRLPICPLMVESSMLSTVIFRDLLLVVAEYKET